LCYAEHEKAYANAAYVPVLTGECQVIAGFRCQLKLMVSQKVKKPVISSDGEKSFFLTSWYY